MNIFILCFARFKSFHSKVLLFRRFYVAFGLNVRLHVSSTQDSPFMCRLSNITIHFCIGNVVNFNAANAEGLYIIGKCTMCCVSRLAHRVGSTLLLQSWHTFECCCYACLAKYDAMYAGRYVHTSATMEYETYLWYLSFRFHLNIFNLKS